MIFRLKLASSLAVFGMHVRQRLLNEVGGESVVISIALDR